MRRWLSIACHLTKDFISAPSGTDKRRRAAAVRSLRRQCIVAANTLTPKQDLLLNVVASAFYYNAGLAMGALQAAGAVQHAFAAWLGGIGVAGKHFRRLYDKKARPRGLQHLDYA